MRNQRNKITAQVALANGQPQSLITAQQPPNYDQAERLANWTKPELSCDGFVESTAAPGSAPLNQPPAWSNRKLSDRLKAATANTNMEEVALGNTEPPSPGHRSQGSGSLKWVNVVRQIQRNK